MLQVFLEGGTKYSQEEIFRQRVEQRLKKSPSRNFPNWGSIPHTDTKPGLGGRSGFVGWGVPSQKQMDRGWVRGFLKGNWERG